MVVLPDSNPSLKISSSQVSVTSLHTVGGIDGGHELTATHVYVLGSQLSTPLQNTPSSHSTSEVHPAPLEKAPFVLNTMIPRTRWKQVDDLLVGFFFACVLLAGLKSRPSMQR
jgi:hypothetical protein